MVFSSDCMHTQSEKSETKAPSVYFERKKANKQSVFMSASFFFKTDFVVYLSTRADTLRSGIIAEIAYLS